MMHFERHKSKYELVYRLIDNKLFLVLIDIKTNNVIEGHIYECDNYRHAVKDIVSDGYSILDHPCRCADHRLIDVYYLGFCAFVIFVIILLFFIYYYG